MRGSSALGLAVSSLLVIGCTGSAAPSGAGGVASGAVGVASDPPRAATVASGCSLPSLGFDLSVANDDAAKYAGRSVPVYPQILSTGVQISSADAAGLSVKPPRLPQHQPAGLPLQALTWQEGEAPGAASATPATLTAYYSAKPIGPQDTFLDVVAAPGVVLTMAEATGIDADRVLQTVGDRADIIDVGPYKAALTHSSTYANGVRTFNLYWSDGAVDYGLVVNSSAKEAIETAQSIYCP